MSITLRPDFPNGPVAVSRPCGGPAPTLILADDVGAPIATRADSLRGPREPAPAPATPTGAGDILLLRLALSACLPPRIRNGRLADRRDIELRREKLAQVEEAFADFRNALISELNSNLPVTRQIDDRDIAEIEHDCAADRDGRLMAREDADE